VGSSAVRFYATKSIDYRYWVWSLSWMRVISTLNRAAGRLLGRQKSTDGEPPSSANSTDASSIKQQPAGGLRAGLESRPVYTITPPPFVVPTGIRRGRLPPGPKPPSIELTPGLLKKLRTDASRRGAPYWRILRTRIILTLADNPSVSNAARKLETTRHTVRFWRNRYLLEGRKGLKTRPIHGCPPVISAIARCELLAVACSTPADFGVPFQDVWTQESLLETYRARNRDLERLSMGTLHRILNEAKLKPHKLKMWLHSPDPDFRAKVTQICNLYHVVPPNSIVLCIDEKTGMQALGRKHQPSPPQSGKAGKFEYEYIRNGTRSLIAAFNPHTGEVFGQVRAKRKAVDLLDFMEALAAHCPDGDIHVVWDNLNIHHDGPSKRWTEFNARHGGRFHFHYTPIHASWVNQVELFFGILHRRVLKYGIFNHVTELELTVIGFLNHWNQHERHPFAWKFKGYPCVETAPGVHVEPNP